MTAVTDLVRKLQIRLGDLGFDPKGVDGVAGPNTLGALNSFLRHLDLPFKADIGAGGVVLTLGDSGSATSTYPSAQAAVEAQTLPWMKVAVAQLGLNEQTSNASLRRFLSSDRATVGDPAKLPWCGDFVETCIKTSLPQEPFPGKLGQNPYFARNWLFFGHDCAPVYGAVVVFERGPNAGHVAFLVGQDDDAFYTLGGNQSDAVTIARIAKSRALGFRWPVSFQDATILQALPRMSPGQLVLSTNET
jgi:uncharacterized protein (TIGR02594 family)